MSDIGTVAYYTTSYYIHKVVDATKRLKRIKESKYLQVEHFKRNQSQYSFGLSVMGLVLFVLLYNPFEKPDGTEEIEDGVPWVDTLKDVLQFPPTSAMGWVFWSIAVILVFVIVIYTGRLLWKLMFGTPVTQPSAATVVASGGVASATPLGMTTVWKGFVLVLIAIVGIMGYLLFQQQPISVIFGKCDSTNIMCGWLANVGAYKPLLLAPIAGVMSYYFSNKGYRRFGVAVWATLIAAILIYLILDPSLLKATIDPIVGSEAAKEFTEGDNSKLYWFAAGLLILGILSGYVWEALFLALFLYVAWFAF